MPMVEIDEAQLQQLQTLQAFTAAALANPKTRKDLLRIDKTLNPNKAIPEIDAADPILDEMKGIREELKATRDAMEADKASREEAEAMAKLSRQWDAGKALARERNYTAEGIEQIEKWMHEKGVADWEIALDAWEKRHPPEIAAPTGSQSWDLFDQQTRESPDFKLLFENPDDQGEAFLRQAVPIALKEARGR